MYVIGHTYGRRNLYISQSLRWQPWGWLLQHFNIQVKGSSLAHYRALILLHLSSFVATVLPLYREITQASLAMIVDLRNGQWCLTLEVIFNGLVKVFNIYGDIMCSHSLNMYICILFYIEYLLMFTIVVKGAYTPESVETKLNEWLRNVKRKLSKVSGPGQ